VQNRRLENFDIALPYSSEPVSEGKFPANREIYREFYENWAVWQKIARENAAKSVSCKTIPYKMKQGINLRRTGNLFSRAGNCPPGVAAFVIADVGIDMGTRPTPPSLPATAGLKPLSCSKWNAERRAYILADDKLA
jgi:hypothetical protein